MPEASASHRYGARLRAPYGCEISLQKAQISQLPSELFRRLSLGRIDPAPFIEEAPPQRRGWHVASPCGRDLR